MTDEDDGRRHLLPPWLIPLLIGLITITAGVFTWRAGQLGSDAAFQDRQAVGQTIKQQEQQVDARLEAISASVAYVRYVADYAEAAALDDLAAELDEQGEVVVATSFRDDATRLRRGASDLAEAAGVFGEQAVRTQTIVSPDEPLPFDIDEQVERNEASAATGIGSPGVLDPDAWAEQADDTRSRVRALRLATLFLLVAVVAFTVAQLADRRPTRLIGAATGAAVFAFVSISTIATVY